MGKSNDQISTAALPTAAVAALQSGNKVQAIKVVREEQGLELKEAKGAVDEYLRLHPELQETLSAGQTKLQNTALFWFVVMVALVLYYYFQTP